MKKLTKRTCFVMALSLTVFAATTANAVEIEKQAFITNVSLKDVETLVNVVRAWGYRCDSVTVARPFIVGGRGYVLECNHYSYKYEIEDRGGNWIVCFKEC